MDELITRRDIVQDLIGVNVGYDDRPSPNEYMDLDGDTDVSGVSGAPLPPDPWGSAPPAPDWAVF